MTGDDYRPLFAWELRESNPALWTFKPAPLPLRLSPHSFATLTYYHLNQTLVKYGFP